jgi:hypothetical protein
MLNILIHLLLGLTIFIIGDHPILLIEINPNLMSILLVDNLPQYSGITMLWSCLNDVRNLAIEM